MSNDLRIAELERELEEKRKEIESLNVEKQFLEQTSAELREKIHQYQGVVNSSTSLIAFLQGPDYTIQFANPAIRNVWGKGDDVVGKPLFEVIPEVKEQGIEDYFRQVYYEGEAFHAEGLSVEHIVNGERIKSYFDFSYMPQKDDNEKIYGIGIVAQNVTKQVLLNKDIRRSEREFRELINFMPHKISMTDAEGNPHFYNQNWLDYVGMSLEEFREQSYIEILHPDDKERVSREVDRCFAAVEDMHIETRIQDKNGDYIWHLSKAIPIKDIDGNITCWISSSTEIQQIKEEEKRKEDFLKLISHELKTPVTSIKGYVQLLLAMISKEQETSAEQLKMRPYLNRMETQIEKLIRLIAEMLDLSRIEQNELELKKENFGLNKLVEEVVEDLSYSNKDIQIQLDHELECEVNADKDRLGQVIINLVTNALKYSPESNKVNIKIYEAEPGHVAVSIKDFGIGIKKSELGNIFKRFYRVSGNKDETYAGFGIGLYLSNEIIVKHEGEMLVKSTPGEGSEFIFTIPLNHT